MQYHWQITPLSVALFEGWLDSRERCKISTDSSAMTDEDLIEEFLTTGWINTRLARGMFPISSYVYAERVLH